jgi:transketolase
MGTIVNGMALHGGVQPYGATFLIFSDYMRPAIRIAALMKAHSIFIFTHDSIGLGQDGPTHQPVEHLMSLRAMPELTVLRPADANETAACWRIALDRKGPCALVLTRQDLPVIDDVERIHEGVPRGAYVLAEADAARPDMVLIATGSEVSLALKARELLAQRGVRARVVSMPSWELFEEQPQAFRDEVLPPSVTARIAIEAGATLGWSKYVGDHGGVIGLDHFGASAPAGVLFEKFGFTPEHVAERAEAVVARLTTAPR